MKIIIIIIIILILVGTSNLSSQDYHEYTHQYLVEMAWQYLKHDRFEINWDATDMNSHIGTTEQGDPGHPWVEGKVVIGAYREDFEDPVYYWRDDEPDPTVTHFWKADDGENWTFCPYPNWFNCYPNSYQKAMVYIWGGQKIFFRYNEPFFREGRIYSYNSLFDFFLTGRCYYHGYVAWGGQEIIEYDPPVEIYMDITQARNRAYCILGRVAHLLGDMGVPCHSHGDQHDPYVGGTDMYEDYMVNSNFFQWDWHLNPIPVTGYSPSYLGPAGVIYLQNKNNPVKYLFYLNNQVANAFGSSEGYYGNSIYNQVDPISGDNYTSFLQPIYSRISAFSYPASNPPATTDHLKIRGNYCFLFSIKSIASLLNWFAENTNQIPPSPPSNLNVTTNMPGNPTLGYELYRGMTGNFNATVQGTSLQKTWTLKECSNPTPVSLPYTINIDQFVTTTPNSGLNFGFYNRAYVYTDCPTLDGPITDAPDKIYLTTQLKVWNTGGAQWSPIFKVTPKQENPPGGCPYVFIYTKDSLGHNRYIADNNILHRSEFNDNVNQSIKDLYHLTVYPDTIDNQISIQVVETEHDYNYFDHIKLIAVDHPAGTKIGITESNDIIMYSDADVTSTDGATLNTNFNITNNIQYYYQGTKIISGNEGDNIYAHYDTNMQMRSYHNIKSKYPQSFGRNTADSLALVGNLWRNPIWGATQKREAGNIDITTKEGNFLRSFARRENSSVVVIPFSGASDAVDHIDVNWNDDYSLTYFSVTPIMYSGFDTYEMPLASAIHTTWGDVIPFLDSVDNVNAEMDTSAIIDLRFNIINAPQHGYIRDYVIQVNGWYTTGSGNRPNMMPNPNVSKTELENPYQYKLYLNYPNPFNPVTIIKYDLAKASNVHVKIYNLLGQLVTELVNEYQSSGAYEVKFDATNLASGVYIYRIEAGDFTDSKKMVLMK